MPVTRSPSRPVSGSPAYSPTDLPVYRGGQGGSAPSFTPDSLLAGITNSFWRGKDGALFQDAAETTPATATDDPIGGVDNQSAIGTATLTQSTTADKFKLGADGRIVRDDTVSTQRLLYSGTIDLADGFCFAMDVEAASGSYPLGGDTNCLRIARNVNELRVRVGVATDTIISDVFTSSSRKRIIMTGNSTDYVVYVDGEIVGTFASQTTVVSFPNVVIGTNTATAANGDVMTLQSILFAEKDLRANVAEIDAWLEANA